MKKIALLLSILALALAPSAVGAGGEPFEDGGGGGQVCSAGAFIPPNQWEVTLCGYNYWRNLHISTSGISHCAVQFYYFYPGTPGPSASFCSDVNNYSRPGYGAYRQIRASNYTGQWVYVYVNAST